MRSHFLFSGLLALHFLLIASQPAYAQGELVNGGFVEGEISSAGEFDEWTFHCEPGVRFYLRVAELSGTGFEPQLQLYRPGATSSSASNFGSNSTAIGYTPTEAGTFTVRIQDYTSSAPGTGSYRIYLSAASLDYTTPAGDEGGILTNGQSLTGVIGLADVDMFTVRANAGEEIFLQTARTSGTSSALFLALYDPDGTLERSGIGINAAVRHVAEVAGTYTVQVMDSSNDDGSGTAVYQLCMSLSNADYLVPDGDEGGLITSGHHYDGTIGRADVDAYHFNAVANEILSIQLADTSTSSLTPDLILYRPDGVRVSGISTTTTAKMDVVATVGGKYTLLVLDGNNGASGSGGYRLHFARASVSHADPEGNEGGPLASGGAYDGVVDLADIDVYHIDMNAGETLRLHVLSTSGGNFAPYVSVFAPDGSSTQGSGIPGISNTLTAQASVSGRYNVFVRDGTFGARESGSYRLFCAKTSGPYTIPAGDEGGSISGGTPRTGTIGIRDIDQYSFLAVAGATYDLRLTDTSASAFQPKIELFGPTGELIDSSFGGTTASLSITTAIAGEYSVVITDSTVSSSSTGTYELALTETLPPALVAAGNIAGTVTSGDTVSGILAPDGVDQWEFHAQAGETVRVQLGISNIDSAIIAPDGSLKALGLNRFGITYQFKAGQTGTYRIIAKSRSSSLDPFPFDSPYAITYANFSHPYMTPEGDEGGNMENGEGYTGTLGSSDFDVWDFHAEAGDRIVLQISEVAGGPPYSPDFSVFGPDGNLIATDHDGSMASSEFIAPGTGTYLVAVGMHNNTIPASYVVCHARVPGAFTVSTGDQGGMMQNGGEYTGEITSGELDIWTFNARPGEKIQIRITENFGSNLLPRIRVYTPQGEAVWSEAFSNLSSVSFIAREEGAYSVVMSGNNRSSGQYHIHLSQSPLRYMTPEGDEGGGIESGSPVSGTLPPGGKDMWSFHAEAGNRITVGLTDTSGDNAFSPNFIIYDPDGAMVTDKTQSVTFTALASGIFTVVISEQQAQVSGSYTLVGNGMVAKPAEIFITDNGSGGLILSWPSPSTGWSLEESETLATESWTTCPAIVEDNGFEKKATIGITTAGKGFYRLSKP